MPGIWAWLDTLPKAERPTLLRGDIAYCSESVTSKRSPADRYCTASPHKPNTPDIRAETRLTITSTHAKQATIQAILTNLTDFLSGLNTTAEQLTDTQRLRAILACTFEKFMLATAGPPGLLTSQTAG